VSDAISRSRPRPAAILAAVFAVVVLTAACSGSPSAAGGPGRSSPASASPSADGPGGSSAGKPAASQKQLAYSECMRKHGVPGVPTSLPSIAPGPQPTNSPHWNAASVSGPNPNSPQFLAAQQACRSLAPPPRWVPG
jgi:hypothetical protein